MYKFGLVLTCLICAGQGLLQSAPIKPSQSSLSEAHKNLPHALLDGVSNSQPFLRARQARSLAGLLLAVHPASAFIISGAAELRTAVGHRRAPLPMAQPSAAQDSKDYLGAAAKESGEWAQELLLGFRRNLVQEPNDNREELSALNQKPPQLSPNELFLLGSTAVASLAAPYLFSSLQVVKVLTSTMGAIGAAVGFTSEYVGKVAVAQGKEVGAIALRASAEAETLLAQAERAKAIIPFTVGSTCALAASSLIAPAVMEELAHKGITHAPQVQVFLVCPVACVIAAAVAVLACQETKQLAGRAMGIGVRRFAEAKNLGRSWSSATQQITASVDNTKVKWRDFAMAVLPGPVAGFFSPGAFEEKAVIAAAVAAAQCAYSLAESEFYLAKATDAVAIKTRCAAVADCYANQGARAGSLLPFTSAVCVLFAATTVAAVDFLPAIASVAGVAGQSLLCFTGPVSIAVAAAAAAVSKAQCQTSVNSATVAATKLSDNEDLADPPDPRKALKMLVSIIFKSSRRQAKRVFSRFR